VLVLCTHNRTRSVLIAEMLRRFLPADGFDVASAGFNDEDLPPTVDTLRFAATLQLDIVAHRSRRVTSAMVADAAVVLCAERQHVLEVVANLGGAFNRTFTLPEFAAGAGESEARPSGFAYLQAPVPEVDDPTGRPEAVWQRAFAELQPWCAAAAARLMR
jgi:protein-tyrosine-phosphatase